MGVSLALMATTLSSCDLDTTPTTSLDSDAAFKTTTYAENVLRGAQGMARSKFFLTQKQKVTLVLNHGQPQ